MGNIPKNSVICKCLNLLDINDDYRCPFLDHRIRKLTVVNFIKLFIEAVLNKRGSLDEISEHLRSSHTLQQLLGLDSISPSQLSRKLRSLPPWLFQELFLHLVGKLQHHTKGRKGIDKIGRLNLIDSTALTLPEIAGQWAYCQTSRNGVKMHIRLVVADQDTFYPDRIIASTADVADSEVVMEMVVADDAIYVMDRGYIVYSNYKVWQENSIRFVARIQKRNKTQVVRERAVPEGSTIERDADVIVRFKENGQQTQVELRLVEFHDDNGQQYRLLTDVRDLSAEQIAEIYRHRWTIELFFKWIKQHLRLVKLYSVQPDAVWCQMYLALIAYCLVLLVKLETGAKQTPWQVLKLLRIYSELTWQTFLEVLFREPARTSKGRRKKPKRGRPRKHPKKLKGANLIVK